MRYLDEWRDELLGVGKNAEISRKIKSELVARAYESASRGCNIAEIAGALLGVLNRYEQKPLPKRVFSYLAGVADTLLVTVPAEKQAKNDEKSNWSFDDLFKNKS